VTFWSRPSVCRWRPARLTVSTTSTALNRGIGRPQYLEDSTFYLYDDQDYPILMRSNNDIAKFATEMHFCLNLPKFETNLIDF
jgi:hypothetical protein